MIVEEKKAGESYCCVGGKNPGLSGTCLGSRCMAWRWANENQRNYIDPYGNVSPSINTSSSTTHGYCGLAGRP